MTAPTPSGAMQDTATREEMVEIAAEGISDRIDIDTGPQEWAEGAVDALLAAGFIATPDAAARLSALLPKPAQEEQS